MRPRAFFPNLDADSELAAPGPYLPTRPVLAQIRAQLPRLSTLVRDDRVLDPESPARFDESAAESVCCWCPTSRALDTLRTAGWPVAAAPGMDVLRQVNDRRFLLDASDSEGVLERAWVGPEDDLSWLRTSFARGRRLRLKRPFGFAGKGQRTVGAEQSADDLRWIKDSRRGGFVRELECEIVAEWSLHGVVDGAGVLLGTPCRQWCDRFGQSLRSEVAPDFEHMAELYASAEHVAEQLRAAGYFGPFGVDAFVYRHGAAERFNALSDLNARFTLAWSVGMGHLREEAFQRMARAQ
jgi:hypothetical protein